MTGPSWGQTKGTSFQQQRVSVPVVLRVCMRLSWHVTTCIRVCLSVRVSVCIQGQEAQHTHPQTPCLQAPGEHSLPVLRPSPRPGLPCPTVGTLGASDLRADFLPLPRSPPSPPSNHGLRGAGGSLDWDAWPLLPQLMQMIF